jgi:hypothetical protein
MSNRQLLTYFGHHKCGTTWIHGILTEVCLKMTLKIAYVHSARQFEGDIDAFVEKNGIDLLTYANADIDLVRRLKTLKGFHVIRDPRDIVVSSYFSHLYSHPVDDWAALSRHRERLQTATKEDGLLLDIRFMEDELDRLDRWDSTLPGVMELKMEELISDPRMKFMEIFRHLDMLDEGSPAPGLETGKISWPALDEILKQKSFTSLSEGRKPGEENVRSHFRKGIAGDWVNHFSGDHKKYFKEKYNHLLVKLGYETDANW